MAQDLLQLVEFTAAHWTPLKKLQCTEATQNTRCVEEYIFINML